MKCKYVNQGSLRLNCALFIGFVAFTGSACTLEDDDRGEDDTSGNAQLGWIGNPGARPFDLLAEDAAPEYTLIAGSARGQGQVDENEYIVVLKGAPLAQAVPGQRADVEATIDRIATSYAVAINHRYRAVLRGFSGRMRQAAASALASDPAVDFVEQDRVVRASDIQSNATWGLDRIDQIRLPLDGNYHHRGDGRGATVFVIDTGINTSHLEFTGRLLPGASAIDDGNGVEDCNGHGTHVAGTAAGTIFGIAKKAMIVPIRVLDCEGSGPLSGIVAGLDFVAQHHPAGSVANLSLGSPASPATDAAIRNASASGVTMVVAAGNEAQDACNVSPAREPLAITVGATTVSDARSDFSNFGSCVDISAPGTDITSSWIGSPTSINTISGTSMASPHVAGTVAVFLGQHPTATPAGVAAALLAGATPGRLADLKGSPNLLLNTTFAAPAPAPAVAIASPVDGTQVLASFTVTVNVSGEDLVKAELLIDGTSVEIKTQGVIAFEVKNLPADVHTLKVIVTDAANQSGSDTVTVIVKRDHENTDEGGCVVAGGSADLGMLVALLAMVFGVRCRRSHGGIGGEPARSNSPARCDIRARQEEIPWDAETIVARRR